MEQEEAIRLYLLYQEARESIGAPPRLAVHATSFEAEARGLLAGEYEVNADARVRSLANFVNEFVYNWQKLQAWGQVLDVIPVDQHLGVLFEFVNPAAYFCLSAPAAIKGRLHHSIARVSNIANERAVSGHVFERDLGSSSGEQARAQASHWTAWPDLAHRLGALDNRDYRRSVKQFRNEFHHAEPPLLGFGTRPFVERAHPGVQVHGIEASVPISEVASAIGPQAKAAVAAHDAFRTLVEEQRSALMSNRRIERTPQG